VLVSMFCSPDVTQHAMDGLSTVTMYMHLRGGDEMAVQGAHLEDESCWLRDVKNWVLPHPFAAL